MAVIEVLLILAEVGNAGLHQFLGPVADGLEPAGEEAQAAHQVDVWQRMICHRSKWLSRALDVFIKYVCDHEFHR